MLLMVLALLLFCKASAIPYPDIDASLDELVVYYTSFSFTTKEVLGFLLNIHHIMLSERSFYRIKKRLRLQKRGVESAIADIVTKILQLRNAGYTNIGYRSLWNVLRCLGVRASQHTVRLVLKAIDGDGVLMRQRHRLTRRRYTSNGPSFCIHVDGYDKLKPFGISVHGGIDGFSRKILWLKATSSNKNPRIVAGHFLEYLKTSKRVPRVVRMDAGTENVIVERIQIALRSFHADSMAGHRSVSIGRSTANQKIEMLWSFLMRNFTTFWRNLFKDMVDEGILNNADPVHLECIRFCFLPLIQRHLDMFLQSWNSHRIRSQRNVECPHGIPDVMFYQPFIYDKYDCSYELPCDIVVLDYLTDIYTDAVLPRGTKEEFRQLINTLTFLDIGEFDVIETPTQAKELFNLLSGVISQHLLNR
ncbi:unnamed protein product [Mytilus edulis]|uniref:Integrase core domain-containing protein n=1 Tax=Mytilus edulis TaxID=6550 RepID=A0A8S3UZW0_MYTED|nr:unnamed protein product [Mytilus edulis]